MKKWLARGIVVGVLAALGFWGWRVFFPSPEEMIRKRLGEVAKAASSSSKEGLLAKALNASALGEFFTLDVQITIDVPGTQHAINGRDELMQAVVGARSQGGSLSIEFPDIKVAVSPDGNSAVVNLTAKAKVSRPQETYFQELRVRMTRVKRDWLINQVETVKTISLRLKGLPPIASQIRSPWKRREPNSPSPYPLPRGVGAWPVAGNVEAPQWVIARRILRPLLWGEGGVRGNGCPELEMGSVKFHAAPNPGSGSGVLCLVAVRGQG